MYKKKFKSLIYIFFLSILATIFIGCSKQDNPEQIQKRFDEFTNKIFKEEVQSDTLSLNYSLANPENYGIFMENITLGDYSITKMKEGLTRYENYLANLNEFDVEALTESQKLTYEILKNYIEMDLELGNYLYYSEVLGPTTGIQAQLPILLAEYKFYTKADIDKYIQLLPCVYDYFKAIIQFEKEKSKRGLFMSDRVADSIINQCLSFIEDRENNFLVEYFNEKISNYEGLSETEIKTYIKANKEGVLEYVIPAYELLVNSLIDLKGSGKNDKGLYYYPDGQTYYETLAKIKTGSDKSMEEMAQMLDNAISQGVLKITTLSLTDASIMDKYMNFTSFPITDPEKILTDLQKDILIDFPEPVPVNCEIKYVHKSLAEYLSPAMYLVPAIDDYKNNNIYINGNDEETLATIYTTVAHEGYPGHLYQCVYFRNQNPAPIRNTMNFLGYDEGWATYVELYSYHLAGIDHNLADFLEANNVVILSMYGRADIGIHYEGWTKEKVVQYVMNFISDEEIAEMIYYTLLEEPAIYLPYAVGCQEFLELRSFAETEMGNQFVAKDFHQFLLDIGPAQFKVIKNYLKLWIEENLS